MEREAPLKLSRWFADRGSSDGPLSISSLRSRELSFIIWHLCPVYLVSDRSVPRMFLASGRQDLPHGLRPDRFRSPYIDGGNRQ
jgi:hypothetical protein